MSCSLDGSRKACPVVIFEKIYYRGRIERMTNTVFSPNPGQQKVYDHQGGPLLVVAGAGTGKTRTITEKISQLLDEGVKPAEILAVTFTEKAAGEMLDRILRARSGILLDLPIMTFNGYGDSILREFGVHIGLSSSYRLLGEEGQIVFFRERIQQFNLDYFLPNAGFPDSSISTILRFISSLKQNLITPEAFAEHTAALPAGDEAEAVDKKMYTELAGIYGKYIELCRQDNFIDYDDQIYLTIQLLGARPNIRRTLQDRYKMIFIDEFQDTNPMQSKLIDLIVGKDQNLIVVGDDDQAIYGFRGATLSNIIGFKDRYPDAAEAALTINYRSAQPILDAAYKLIQHNNPHRLEASLALNKRLTSDCPGNAPELLRFHDTRAELQWIAGDISRRLSELGPDESPSIAILTRSNASNQLVHRALSIAGVPHRVVGASPDLYQQPIVQMLTELVRTIVEPENNASLHHTLVSDLFGISNQLMSEQSYKAKKSHKPLREVLQDVPETTQALQLIDSWRAGAASMRVGNLLWQAVQDSGYKDRLLADAMTSEQAAASVTHLGQYFDTLAEFAKVALQPTATQYLVSLPALRAGGENVDDTLDITESEVVVTTIHKAKGLEWNTVYIPLLMSQTFPFLGGSSGIRLPEALAASTSSEADSRLAEERRLMYVAATRARRDLILSFANFGNGTSSRPRKPSVFIDEMFGEGTAENTPVQNTDTLAADFSPPVADNYGVSVPSNILDGHTVRLSASQASTLLECPLDFYFRYVLRVPSPDSSSTNYGSLMHDLFKQINQGRQDGALPPLPTLQQQLDDQWSNEGYISLDQAQRSRRLAHQTLEQFYTQAEAGEAPLEVEKDFEVRLAEEDIVLHGRMDVVVDSGGTEIRDYKTGLKNYDGKDAKSRASGSTQLSVYALAWLINHDEVPKVGLQFVDINLVGSVSKQAKSLDTLRAKLAQAAEDIRAGRFEPRGQHKFCTHPPVGEE